MTINIERPNTLLNPIEVRATSRPIKVAYLVSTEESPTNHLIMDAVFHESYTRWAGAFTLIVPTNENSFTAEAFGDWLRFFDPDFVYSYVAIDSALVEKIEALCSPISILQHHIGSNVDDVDWRNFIGKWRASIQPVSSITTTSSPRFNRDFSTDPEEKKVTVLTAHLSPPETRVFADNFGRAFGIDAVTPAVPGLYKTLCLTPLELPAYQVTGSERCATIAEVFSAITSGEARTIAEFSRIHSDAIPRLEPSVWSHSFKLFIGSTVLDRIHFWNSRHFVPWHSTSLGALIVPKDFFDDDKQVQKLGEFFDRTNYLGWGNSQYEVTLFSQSENDVTLQSLRDKLQAHTYNSIVLDKDIDRPAVPSKSDISDKRSQTRNAKSTTLRIAEDYVSLSANEPDHFQFIPPRMRGIAKGQWVVDLDIGRHNNLSRYSNVVESWVLPRRHGAVSAFTDLHGKITDDGHLAILPVTSSLVSYDNSIHDFPKFGLRLPSDESFFRHLLLSDSTYLAGDLRASVANRPYENIAISDKGQNLRGVVSMFRSLAEAYEILTNKFWRDVLREANEDSAKPLVFKCEKLNALLPNDRAIKQKLVRPLGLENVGQVNGYMAANLKDTLEYLVRSKVFYQVHQWRCNFCGNVNSRSFDAMRIKSGCVICETEYLAPIDLVWEYQFNEFVHRSLAKQHGLPVLWTLGFLQKRARKSFWYLPEVDLYEKYERPDTKSEIDLLGIIDGLYYAVEVKRTATQFLHKAEEAEKFIKKINSLEPDVAVLSFERYCEQDEDIPKIRAEIENVKAALGNQIAKAIKIEVIVACDIAGFNDHSGEVGYVGPRSLNFS